MYFLIFIILLLALFVSALFYESAIVHLKFNTNQDELYLNLNWLNVSFRAKVKTINYTSYVSIYLFKIFIYSKIIKKMTGKSKVKGDYYKALVLDNTYVNVYYGLNNPFSTGIASGIINIIQYYFNGVYIAQFPDFLTESEYIYINAGCKLNIGKTIVNIMRMKQTKKNKRRELSWNNLN